MSHNLVFLDFTLNTQQQRLSQGGNRIEVSSTAYKLLVYLLQNSGETLSRQDLTEYVWPNRVVTETSLDKLIQRVRKALGDTGQQQRVIRTIHGVGFVFLPEVTAAEESPDQSTVAKRLSGAIWLGVAMLVGVALVFWYQNHRKSTPLTAQTNAITAPHQTIALVPKHTALANQDGAWMITGGMHYLKEQLNLAANLEVKNIGLDDMGTESPDRYAIEMSLDKQMDAAILVEIKEVDQQFIAAVKIRNSDGVLATEEVHSASIKSLYDEINELIQQTLSIQTLPTAMNTNSVMSQDSYAVENYIRGMSAQSTGYAAEAIKYFDLATKEDPEFWLAWYELSLAHRKQGDYEQALSIINVFENVPLAHKNNLMIQNAKALNHYYLGNYATGIEALDAGILTARNNGLAKELSTFLTNKALFAKAMDDLKLAQLSIQESIAIIHTLEGDQNSKLGAAYNTLAGIEINLYDYHPAQEHAARAIDHFQLAGKKRSVATAKSRLSSIKYALGSWTQAETLIKEVLASQQELDDTLGQTTSYMRLSDYSLMRGEFAVAQSQLNRLSELMGELSNKYQNDSYLITQVKIKIHTGWHQDALNLLVELKPRITTDNRLFSYFMLSLELFELTQDDDKWLSTANEFTNLQNFNQQPQWYLIKAKVAEKQGRIAAAKNAFQQAKLLAFERQAVITVAEVMNPYIVFLLDHDPEAAYMNLLALEAYPVPAYPFLKIKAQVLQHQEEYFKALALMEELKSVANDHWTVDDQLRLEALQLKLAGN